MRHLLPSPYFPRDGYDGLRYMTGGQGAANTAAWPAANRAIYVPVSFPCDVTLASIMMLAGNGTGNYDLGFYSGDLVRLASSGSTAMSAAGVKTLPLPDLRVRAGVLHYAALVLSSGSGQVWRRIPASVAQTVVCGLGQEALGATTLPNPATPVAVSSAYIPLFAFGVR